MKTIYQNTRVQKAWDYIVGSPEEFNSENRRVNALGAIILFIFLAFQPINMLVVLPEVAWVTAALTLIQGIVYYLSRFRKKYTLAVAIFAIVSFSGLVITYYYDSGMKGPNICLFFLNFQVLISITRRRYHLLWFSLHALLAVALMGIEYLYPGIIPIAYTDRTKYFTDYIFTFLICLAFVYMITDYLLRIYIKEKATTKQHAQEIVDQNKKLQEIARLQSHEVRNHVATIMGLTQLFNNSDMNDPANKEVIDGIAATAADLDASIKNINQLTNIGGHP